MGRSVHYNCDTCGIDLDGVRYEITVIEDQRSTSTNGHARTLAFVLGPECIVSFRELIPEGAVTCSR